MTASAPLPDILRYGAGTPPYPSKPGQAVNASHFQVLPQRIRDLNPPDFLLFKELL